MDCNTYLQQLPNVKTLKQLCKGQAVLDWIICGHEYEVYHTYYKANEEEYDGYEAQWGHGFEDEDGSSLSFYFVDKACIIVPSSSAEDSKGGDNHDLERKLPKVFLPYYRKNFAESDIPFVIYSLDGETWHCIENFAVEEHIDKFDKITTNPAVYKEWAKAYLGEEAYLQETMSEQTISDIYAGKVLTEEMVYSLVTEVYDWVDLETEPNGGTIFLDNTEITHYPMYKRAQSGIGYLAQEASVFRKLSIEDNIKSVLQLTKLSKAEQQRKTDELIDEFSLGHIRKNRGDLLSGGERRRTEIARALATSPKFILLDEPFAGVDPIAVEDIQRIVAQLKDKNIGILITDHNVQETLAITDRTYLMFEGGILKSGVPEELAADEMVRKVYLGRNFELRRKKILED